MKKNCLILLKNSIIFNHICFYYYFDSIIKLIHDFLIFDLMIKFFGCHHIQSTKFIDILLINFENIYYAVNKY
jgi:hypothetical protein